MRVLVIANLWPSPASPATGSFVRDQVRQLRLLGAHVDVVAAHPTTSFASRARYGSLAMRALTRSLRARYDIVACHIAFPTGLIGRMARGPAGAQLVLHVHGSDVMALPQRSALHRATARQLFRSADRIVANSDFMRRKLIDEFGVLESSVAVVSPGIDPVFFTNEDASERRDILYAGRLTSAKGVDLLIRAVANLEPPPKGALVIVGHGVAASELGALSKRLKVRTRWYGDIPRAEVAALMWQAAVVVVPSTMPEGLGLTALEGLAARAVVVASKGGALADTIRDGVTGFSADVGSVDSLTGALRNALDVYNSPNRHLAMVDAGIDLASRHEASLAALALFKVYEDTALERAE